MNKHVEDPRRPWWCCLAGGTAGPARCAVPAQGQPGAAGHPAPSHTSSGSGRDAMLTPRIVCQTPRGRADFSRSSFPVLCVSDPSCSTCRTVSSRRAWWSLAEVTNSILNVIFQLHSFLSFFL